MILKYQKGDKKRQLQPYTLDQRELLSCIFEEWDNLDRQMCVPEPDVMVVAEVKHTAEQVKTVYKLQEQANSFVACCHYNMWHTLPADRYVDIFKSVG